MNRKNNLFSRIVVALLVFCTVITLALPLASYADEQDGASSAPTGTATEEVIVPITPVPESADDKLTVGNLNTANKVTVDKTDISFKYGTVKKKDYFGLQVFLTDSELREFYEGYDGKNNYSDFTEKAVIKFLYREKGEKEWLSGTSSIIQAEKVERGGVSYNKLWLNTYDNGLNGLNDGMKSGKAYEIYLQFYKKIGSDAPVTVSPDETNIPEVEYYPVCSSEMISITVTDAMNKEWKEFFAERANVSLTDEGGVNTSKFRSIFDILNIPMGFVLFILNELTSNYLLAIFLFAIVIKLVLFPMGIKQQKNMIKQAKFAPKQMAIQKKYKGRNDRETMLKMQQEIQDAQQKEGISALGGGCLSMILQMLVIICLYNVIRMPLTYMSSVSVDAIGLAKEYFVEMGKAASVSAIDDIKVISLIKNDFAGVSGFLTNNFGYDLTEILTESSIPNFNIFGGFDISEKPGFDLTIIIPVLVFLSYFFSMKITRKLSYQPPKMEGAPDMNASMKIMDFVMPIFSTFISFTTPAMLGIYWIFQSIIGILQQWILKKMYPFPVFTEEDYKKAEREYKGKQPKEKPVKKSNSKSKYMNFDDDDYAELPEKTSFHDLPKEEREKIAKKQKELAEKMEKESQKSDEPKKDKPSMIDKAEIDDKKDEE